MEIVGDRWRDEEGRRLILRGINLGGDSKIPLRPDGATHLREGFYQREGVSFVGRPLQLSEADAHFSRLERWGINFLRLLVTWEAVEHDGPGIYDLEYLDYIEELAAKASERGFCLFVDPHQDVWSRWTGGDGAPIWTLEAAGFEPERLHASGAALLHQELGERYPRMKWFSNGSRLGCATMFSLFFGGDAFAPGIRPWDEAGGESIQAFLQARYIGAMREVAKRVGRFAGVIGFDSLNEPTPGFIGHRDLSASEGGVPVFMPLPSPWDAIKAGSGFPEGGLGSAGRRAWKDGLECVWLRSGVWDLKAGRPRLLRPDHFSRLGGRPVDFASDFLLPFARLFIGEIRGAAERGRRLALFIEGPPEGGRPPWDASRDPGPAVNATHWYDAVSLVLKRWTGFLAFDPETGRIVLGARRVRRFFASAIERIAMHGRDSMGGIPSLLGEFGLPFDINGRRAYPGGARPGDYRVHERALAAYYDAVDACAMDSCIWNYVATNTHAHGDNWNGEDLSVFCADEAAPTRPGGPRSETGMAEDSGGRALRGFVRPYARSVAGDIIGMGFDMRSGDFVLRFRIDRAVSAPTEVFVPFLQYPSGFEFEAEGAVCALAEGSSAVPGADRGGHAIVLATAMQGSSEATLLISRKTR